MIKTLVAILLLGFMTAGSVCAQHSETDAGHHELTLSAELLELLRAEMREVASGMQAIPVLLATAEWHQIHLTAGKIKNSYILKQSLTESQLAELKQILPEPFKEMDGEFHQRAGKLADAAKAKNTEAVAFQYSRMLENCVSCHSMYAQERFPGFSSQPSAHQH